MNIIIDEWAENPFSKKPTIATDTPECDNMAFRVPSYEAGLFVPYSFACQLERRITTMQRDLERLSSEIYYTAGIFDFKDAIAGEPLQEYMARNIAKLNGILRDAVEGLCQLAKLSPVDGIDAHGIATDTLNKITKP